MNVASLLSGWTLDLFRITLRDGFGIRDRPADSVVNSGYRLYLLLGQQSCCLSAVYFPLMLCIMQQACSMTCIAADSTNLVSSLHHQAAATLQFHAVRSAGCGILLANDRQASMNAACMMQHSSTTEYGDMTGMLHAGIHMLLHMHCAAAAAAAAAVAAPCIVHVHVQQTNSCRASRECKVTLEPDEAKLNVFCRLLCR